MAVLVHQLGENISGLHRSHYLQIYDRLRYLMDILEYKVLQNVLDMDAHLARDNKYNPFL